MNTPSKEIREAARLIANARRAMAFTGAGISLESGVPTFRGDGNSIWSKYDPDDIDIENFTSNPKKSWKTIKACFYDFMREKDIRPNKAHMVLAELEKAGRLKAIVTQNIDGLHQKAGSRNVIEFHGTTATMTCTKCGNRYGSEEVDMSKEIPTCPRCGGILKPDFVFFGEGIPEAALTASFDLAKKADLCIVVGTSGVVMPAGMIPILVHENGGKVVEVNPTKSQITDNYSDVFIGRNAVEAFTELEAALKDEGLKL